MRSFKPADDTQVAKIPPSETQTIVSYHGKNYTIFKEGLGEILNLVQPQNTKADHKPQAVFYNPIQQYNRDLSVLAVRAFSEDLAAIRRARAERRVQKDAQHGQKCKKRKREKEDDTTAVEAIIAADDDRVNRVKTGNSNTNATPPNHTEPSSSSVAELPVQGPAVPANSGENAPASEKKKGFLGTVEHAAGQTEIWKTEVHIAQGLKPPEGPKGSLHPPFTSDIKDRNTDIETPPLRILDALSATGLRGLRYAKEIPAKTSITANDLSASATASIKVNIEHNQVSSKMEATTGDARAHMYMTGSRTPYHVIDLDPYGTAAPFLDAAIQALVDGGLLCVTCTDAGVFASTGYLEKTFSQYGGLPLKGPPSHEGGLRLILHAIATSAAQYGIAIEPLLSLSIDFYIRIFVRIHKSPAEVKLFAGKTMIVYNCDEGCGAWTTQPLAQTREKKNKIGETLYRFSLAQAPSTSEFCEHCGFKTHLSGPMWGGPLHNPYFVERMLDILPSLDDKIYSTIPRMEGMLSLALNETLEDLPPQPTPDLNEPSASDQPIHPYPIEGSDPLPDSPSQQRPIPIASLNPSTRSHHPFFLIPSVLAKVIHCISPSDAAFRGALMHLGYRTSRSHTKPGSISTNAPWSVIWEIMREWVRQKAPIKKDALKKGTAGWAIMQNAREKRGLEEAKNEIKKALEEDDLEGMKRGVEAALSRIGKATKAATEGTIEAKKLTEVKKEIREEERGSTPDTNGSNAVAPKHRRSTTPPSTHTSELNIIFDESLGKEPAGKRLVRYQLNPRADWGPMNRAKGE